jgi:hypothetical protein
MLHIYVKYLPLICEALPNVRSVFAAKEDSVDGEERYCNINKEKQQLSNGAADFSGDRLIF